MGGGHAGHEGEEAGVEDCTGKVFAVCSVPWQQGQDRGRLEEDGSHQEQERKDREQEGVGRGEEGLQADLRLDEGGAAGAEAAEGEGFRCREEGYSPLQAREGPLPEVRRGKDEGRGEVVRAPGRGDFCALSKDGLACLLRGSDLMYASFYTKK